MVIGLPPLLPVFLNGVVIVVAIVKLLLQQHDGCLQPLLLNLHRDGVLQVVSDSGARQLDSLGRLAVDVARLLGVAISAVLILVLVESRAGLEPLGAGIAPHG